MIDPGKINRPPLGNVLTRTRLAQKIDGLTDHRLIIISAPAGSGKTTLLVDWGNSAELPICWLSCDDRLTELAEFARYVLAALGTRFPALNDIPLTPDTPINTARDIVTQLNHTIGLNQPVVLMIDDWNQVDTSQAVNEFMAEFLMLTHSVKIVLASRHLVRLPNLATLIVKGYVAEGIDYEEMAFTVDEVKQLSLIQNGLALSTEDAERITKETDGWAMAIALRARQHIAPESAVYDYLDREIFSYFSDDTQKFLLESSVVAPFDTPICHAVLKLPDCAPYINEITNANLSRLQDDNLISYPPLFDDFLTHTIRSQQPEHYHTLTRRLADYQRERGDFKAAYATLRRIEDNGQIIKLIECAAVQMIRDGEQVTLGNWLKALPVAVVEGNAWLLAVRGNIQITGIEADGLADLSRAMALAKPEQLPRILLWRAVSHYNAGRYDAALTDIEAIDLTQDTGLLAETIWVKGNCARRQRQFKEAISHYQQAIAVCGEAKLTHIIKLELALAYEQTNDLAQAERVYLDILNYWEASQNIQQLAYTWNNTGVVYHRQHRYIEAIEAFDKSIYHAYQSGNQRAAILAAASVGDLYRDTRAIDEARIAFMKAADGAKRIGYEFIERYATNALASLDTITLPEIDNLNHIRREIRKRAQHLPYAPAQVDIRSFGRVNVHINQNRVEFKQRSAVHLLFLLLQKARGLTKPEIVADLWPHTTISRSQYHRIVHELRDAMQGVVSFDSTENQWGFDWSSDYYWDVETLLAIESEADLERLTFALELWQGDYLPDAGYEWVREFRDELEQLYLDKTGHVAHTYEANNDRSRATRWAKALLDQDPYDEEAVRILMRAAITSGNNGRAATIYRRCASKLKIDLGIEPSEETKLVLQTIQA